MATPLAIVMDSNDMYDFPLVRWSPANRLSLMTSANLVVTGITFTRCKYECHFAKLSYQSLNRQSGLSL
eukprot:m.338350 g.338350  ORF g.338350 m.338350 type:complete len:69 (+) comp18389_c0_seq1:556-762(+)